MLYDSPIVAYYRFSANDFLKDEFKSNWATITTKSTTSYTGRDYIPNDICFPLTDSGLFYKFSSGGKDINTLSIDGRWSPKESGWKYTVSMWVKISSDTCYTTNP